MVEQRVNDVRLYRDSAGVVRELPVDPAAAATAAASDLQYQQLTAAQLATVQRLSPPSGAATAHVQSNGGSAVRYRGDGIDPTISSGMLLEPGDARDFTGDLTRVAFIDQGANAVLDVTFYG